MSLLTQKAELELEEAELKVKKKLLLFPPLAKWALIIACLGIIPAYFLTQFISADFWQKKYQSYSLAGKASFSSPEEIQIKKMSIIPYSNNTYSILAEIYNPNLELSAKQIDYKFAFFNSGNKEVALISGETAGQTFLLPDQSKFLILPKISASDKINSATITITSEPQWQKKLEIPKANLITSLPVYGNIFDPPAFKAEGYVQNSSSYLLKQIRLVFIVYGKTGEILAVSQRDEFDLKPNERRAYTQLWPNLNLSGVAEIKISAETNVLDPSNLKLDVQPSGSASDLSRPEIER